MHIVSKTHITQPKVLPTKRRRVSQSSPPKSTKEDLLSTLVTSAYELRTKYNVSHHDMLNHVKNTFLHMSKSMPRRNILYNVTHGHFNLSSDFMSYMTEKQPSIQTTCDMREHAALHMFHYGKCICMSYPNIFVIMYNYVYHKNYLDAIKSYASLIDLIDVLQYNEHHIRTLLHSPNTKYGVLTTTSQLHLYSKLDWHNSPTCMYSKSTLELFIEDIAKQTEHVRKSLHDIVNLHPTLTTDIVDEYKKYSQPHQHPRHKTPKPPIFREDSLFMDAIKEHGHMSYIPWVSSQTLYNSKYIKFLLRHGVNTNGHAYHESVQDLMSSSGKTLQVSQDIAEKAFINIGLLCASGTYCQLGMKSIPALMDYVISDHDGKESVDIVY